MSMSRSRGRVVFGSNPPRARAGSSIATIERAEPDGSTPDWEAVEDLLSLLSGTRAVFPTETSSSNWISAYEPGRRLMVESGERSDWVQVDHIRTCWETFERLGRVCRRDVLEPGRRSALMMALFEHVDGVRREHGDEPHLVLSRTGHAASQ